MATFVLSGIGWLVSRARSSRLSAHEVEEVIVKDRPSEEKAVAAIQNTPMAGHQRRTVLGTRSPLPHGFHQVSKNPGHGQQQPQDPAVHSLQLGEKPATGQKRR